MRKASWVAFACTVSLFPVAGWVAETAGEEAPVVNAEAPASGGVPVTTFPAVISRPELDRPDESREARVYVRLMVSAEGIPTEIAVLEDRGYHTEPFRKVALKFVEGMRFKPATRDGVPVAYGPLVQPVNFGFGLPREQQGVTPEFRRELNKVAKFMKDGDYAGAHFHAEWMLREKVKLGYEFAVLQAQLAQTLANVGRFDEALAAAAAATSRNSSESAGFKIGEPPPRNDPARYLLPRDLTLYLLELRMRLEARRGAVLTALKTYNELAGLEKLKADDPRAVFAEQLVAILQSGKALLFNGEVMANREYWSHDLFHPRFTTRNVEGKLGVIHLHCRGQFAQHEYEPGMVWSVPPDWEGCVVEFYGEPGAKLELVEMPAA